MIIDIRDIILATSKKVRAIFYALNVDLMRDDIWWEPFDIILFGTHSGYCDISPRLIGYIAYNGKLMPCEDIPGRDFIGYLTDDFVTPEWLKQQGRDEFGIKQIDLGISKKEMLSQSDMA